MLERVLEPEVMDSELEAREYDAMDHSEVNVRFRDDLLALSPPTGIWLDLGTGTALIPILIAHTLPVEIIAVDLAHSMLALAERNIEAAGLDESIHLICDDAKAAQLPEASFQCVFSNSLVHHLPEAASFWTSCRRLVAPDGLVFVRDLARPESDAALEDLVATYAGGSTDHQRRLFAESLHAALTLAEVKTQAEAGGLAGAQVSLTSDRHWTLVWQAPA